jgi:hypothetical protein
MLNQYVVRQIVPSTVIMFIENIDEKRLMLKKEDNVTIMISNKRT